MRALLVLLACCVACEAAGIRVKHANPLLADTPYTEDQLQNAIDAVNTVCGDIIEIDPGASRHGVGAYILRGPALPPSVGGPAAPPAYAKDCASTGKYITIRSSMAYQLTPGKRVGAGDAANLAFFGLTTGAGGQCTVIVAEPGANYYRLQGLDIAANQHQCTGGGWPLVTFNYVLAGSGALVRPDLFPHHIVIDQCWIHGIDGFSQRDGVTPEGRSIKIINSTIENIRVDRTLDLQESHAIVSTAGLGPTLVLNNKISSGGISVIWGGIFAASPLRGSAKENLEFSGNWMYRPYKWLSWHGTTDPSAPSPCPVDYDGHGALYQNTVTPAYFECQSSPWDPANDAARAAGTWTSIIGTDYDALIAARRLHPNKNIFEIKNARIVHFEGNVLDQAFSWNFEGQLGNCFLTNVVDSPEASNNGLMIENNICRHASSGIGHGSLEGVVFSQRPARQAIFRNNLLQNIGEDMYTKSPFGDITFWAQSAGFTSFGDPYRDMMTYDHNTFQSSSTNTAAFGNFGVQGFIPYLSSRAPGSQRLTNNIWTAGNCAYISSAGGGCNWNAPALTWGPWVEMTANAIIDNMSAPSANMDALTKHCDPGSSPGCPYTSINTAFPPNCLSCQIKPPSSYGFTSYPNDLTLQSGSSLKNAGLDGKDLGADLNMVGWATSGAVSGTLSPYLAMKIRGIVPSGTSVQVRFSAIDTSSCTIEARVYGFPLSSPAATATDSSGTLDRLVTLTGLVANTKYGLKVTCAGSYYREDEFRTP